MGVRDDEPDGQPFDVSSQSTSNSVHAPETIGKRLLSHGVLPRRLEDGRVNTTATVFYVFTTIDFDTLIDTTMLIRRKLASNTNLARRRGKEKGRFFVQNGFIHTGYEIIKSPNEGLTLLGTKVNKAHTPSPPFNINYHLSHRILPPEVRSSYASHLAKPEHPPIHHRLDIVHLNRAIHLELQPASYHNASGLEEGRVR